MKVLMGVLKQIVVLWWSFIVADGVFAAIIVIFESPGLQTSHNVLMASLCSCCCQRVCRGGAFVYDPEGMQVGGMWELDGFIM